MNPETEVDFCVFPALWQAGLPARITAVTGVPPNGGQTADLAILAGIWTHFCRGLLLKSTSTGVSCRRGQRLRP
jgi:hypothetical protein